MPGSGCRITSSPTVPRTVRPSASTTSAAVPIAGPPNEHGLTGVSGLPATIPPLTSVPPL